MKDEKIICRADIRPTPTKAIFAIWYILGAIAFCIGTFGISLYESDESGSYAWTVRYLFFCEFYHKGVYKEDDYFLGKLEHRARDVVSHFYSGFFCLVY
jgi:hypothetical protein